jgi:crotonobetainyl-CoA:carnitine CoA-transferase CaiB-like acyl-CoA transferase
MAELQAAGVPAGMMQRVTDYADDPHLTERQFLRTLTHPRVRRSLPTENGPALFQHIPDPELRPAPMLGEHTRQLCRDRLGLTDTEIDQLIADDVLEEWTDPLPEAR